MTNDVREQLVLDVLPTVTFFAERRHAARPSVPTEVFVQEGVLAAWNCAPRFDSTLGPPFITFAWKRIDGAMLDYVRAKAIRYRRWAQAAQKRIGAAKEALAHKTGRPYDDPADYEVAKELDIGMEKYHVLLRSASPPNTISLDSHLVYEDSGDPAFTPIDPYPRTLEQRADRRDTITQLLRPLTGCEREVVRLYYLDELCEWKVGEILGLSESRICQILQVARRTMRRHAALAGITRDG